MCVGNKECIRLQSDRFIAEALITMMDVSNGRRSILPGDAEEWALHEDSLLEGCLPPTPNPVGVDFWLPSSVGRNGTVFGLALISM